jgi:adenylylsulfate kinase-like enzyme
MSWAVWITGVPGSAKSVIAQAAVEAISAGGHAVELLELDEMRRLVTPHRTDTDVERNLVYRALVYVASRLVDAGVPVIIDATAPRRAWRDLARSVLPRFAEIEVTSGLEMAYERSTCPDLVIDTTRATPAMAAGQIAELVKAWPQTRRGSADPQWTVWITGLPGSGKTTLASNVADALIQQRVDVRILELAELRAFVTAGLWSPLAEDVAHRALVYAAKRLSGIGTPVIVDATAPVRAWRQLARQSIARFAEVQLVCPASVCANRERAVRWGLLGCPHRRTSTAAADGPDIVLAYEHALSPELVIHTDVEDPWSAVHSVLELTLRLQRAKPAQVA